MKLTLSSAACALTGSEAQIEWAERIRVQAAAEFDRFERAFLEVSRRQSPVDRQDTEAIILIVRSYRDQVMKNPSAGYFIRDWQDIGQQIRNMLAANEDCRTIKLLREQRSVAEAAHRSNNANAGT